MDLEEYFNSEEKPLDKLVDGLSNTGIFRKMAFAKDTEAECPYFFASLTLSLTAALSGILSINKS